MCALLQVSVEARKILHEHSVVQHFPRRRIILRRGDAIDGAYVVLAGRLRSFSLSAHGHQSTLYQVNPGGACLFALNCLFANSPYPAWVEASPNTEVAWIQAQAFRTLFHREEAIQSLVIHAFSSAIQRLMDTLAEVTLESLHVRVSRYVGQHADAHGLLVVTQQGIADEIGTTREAVARELGRLAAIKAITTGRGRIRIADHSLLARHGNLTDHE